MFIDPLKNNDPIVGKYNEKTHEFTCGNYKIENCSKGIFAAIQHYLGKRYDFFVSRGWLARTYALKTDQGTIYAPAGAPFNIARWIRGEHVSKASLGRILATVLKNPTWRL